MNEKTRTERVLIDEPYRKVLRVISIEALDDNPAVDEGGSIAVIPCELYQDWLQIHQRLDEIEREIKAMIQPDKQEGS